MDATANDAGPQAVDEDNFDCSSFDPVRSRQPLLVGPNLAVTAAPPVTAGGVAGAVGGVGVSVDIRRRRSKRTGKTAVFLSLLWSNKSKSLG